jgi:hypothetical protein
MSRKFEKRFKACLSLHSERQTASVLALQRGAFDFSP